MNKKCLIYVLLIISFVSCNSEKRIDELIEQLSSPVSHERSRAANRLAEMGEHANRAVATLSNTIDDDDWIVKNAVVGSLAKIGTPEAKKALADALPKFVKYLESDNLENRLYAAEGIGYFGEVATPALEVLYKTAVKSEKMAEYFKDKDTNMERYHKWIANQATLSIQRILPSDYSE